MYSDVLLTAVFGSRFQIGVDLILLAVLLWLLKSVERDKQLGVLFLTA
jgi:hypothetical protein